MSLGKQLTLPLAHRPAQGLTDFLVSDCNRAAFRAVTSDDGAGLARLAISGPEGAGKTHLASIWAQSRGAVRLSLPALDDATLAQIPVAPAVVLEDADVALEHAGPERASQEVGLFHLLNLTKAEGTPLLLTARTPPARWQVTTPDLVSRLSALAHVSVDLPDDDLLTRLLSKLFKDRQLNVGADVLSFLIDRTERSFAAAEEIVAELDATALARRRAITRRLASEVLAARQDTQR
ncbi:MAG: DnaA/Hda family protein [Pseudomonadota bacterium]